MYLLGTSEPPIAQPCMIVYNEINFQIESNITDSKFNPNINRPIHFMRAIKRLMQLNVYSDNQIAYQH